MKKEIKFTKREEEIMYEAFMTGRVYATLGEHPSYPEILEQLHINCQNAIKRMDLK